MVVLFNEGDIQCNSNSYKNCMAIPELSLTQLTQHKTYEITKYNLQLIIVSGRINVELVVADFIIKS